MYKLVLIRHGESTWNLENRFTGWTDVDLTPTGIEQAKTSGRLLREGGWEFDLCYTSVLKRATRTLWHCLDEMDRTWLPVEHSWRLNERHYGALQGLNKAETARQYGDQQVLAVAAQLRRPAAGADAGRSALRARRPAVCRAEAGRRAAHRVAEGGGRAGAAVLARDHGAGDPRRPPGAGVQPTATRCAHW